jgi:Acetyltransferase (GNAT) family
VSVPPEVREYAETPHRYSYVEPGGTVERFDDGRVCILQGPTWATIGAPDVDEDEVEALLAEVRGRVRAGNEAVWWLGPSARPSDIHDRLWDLGLREPLDRVPLLHALALTTAPTDAPPGVRIRPVETYDDFVAMSELRFEAFDSPPERLEQERPMYRTYFEESQRTGIPAWFAASVDGRLAGAAGAVPSDRGVFLIGGATAPWARGRGVYRALVRTRWEYAVSRGTPALVTHAKPDTSYPILLRLGFEELFTLRRLEDRG